MTDLKNQILNDPIALSDFVRGGGIPALVQTAGNVFPMPTLQGKTLVAKISIDGGTTYPTTRTHTFTAATKAEKNFATVGAGNFNSVLEAVTPGVDGNAITIALVESNVLGSGVSISRSGTDYTITYENGVSTVADVEAAIGALTGDDFLIDVKTPGTGATVLGGDDFPATHLSGGTGPSFSSIAAVVSDILADSTFLGGGTPDLLVFAKGNELVIKTKVAGNRALKIDATSTSIGVNLLQYTSNQVGNGTVTTIVSIFQDNNGKFIIFFT